MVFKQTSVKLFGRECLESAVSKDGQLAEDGRNYRMASTKILCSGKNKTVRKKNLLGEGEKI